MKVLGVDLNAAPTIRRPDAFTSFTPRNNPICKMAIGKTEASRGWKRVKEEKENSPLSDNYRSSK